MKTVLSIIESKFKFRNFFSREEGNIKEISEIIYPNQLAHLEMMDIFMSSDVDTSAAGRFASWETHNSTEATQSDSTFEEEETLSNSPEY